MAVCQIDLSRGRDKCLDPGRGLVAALQTSVAHCCKGAAVPRQETSSKRAVEQLKDLALLEPEWAVATILRRDRSSTSDNPYTWEPYRRPGAAPALISLTALQEVAFLNLKILCTLLLQWARR